MIAGVRVSVIVSAYNEQETILESLTEVKLGQNVGKGAAIKAGLDQASMDFILFQDADMEYLPKQYKKLFEPIRKHNADLVMSSRFAAPDYTCVVYLWKKWVTTLSYFWLIFLIILHLLIFIVVTC